MKKLLTTGLIAIGFISFALVSVAQAAGDAAAGKTKAVACSGCHGIDGNSMVPTFPKLAGQNEKYIVNQLKAFKDSKGRKNDIMTGMVAALSEQDMSDIGAFYFSQTLSSAAPADETKLAEGRDIYKGGNLQTKMPACQACHGPDGAGNPGTGYAQVGGQYADYTKAQLMAFKNGERTTDDKAMMRDIVKMMSDKEIDAVSQYIASLK
jgi:cytochrome c553